MHVQDAVAPEDWTFAGADTRYLSHGLHDYPARMIPQIARRLVERYSHPGDVVLDPFCGSGTVLVEARLLGRHSAGVDINPLACLLAKAKTTLADAAALEQAWRKLAAAIEPDIWAIRFRGAQPPPPAIPNLAYWFKPSVISELAAIRQHLDGLKGTAAYYFFAACFSKTVRQVSNLRTGEFKLYRVPPEKLARHNPDAFGTFSRLVAHNLPKMAEFYGKASAAVSCEVVFGDARSLPLGDGRVALVATSPPYGDSRTTVAYGQFSRYSALWLGLEPEAALAVDRRSLGGIPLRAGDLPSPTLKATIQEVAQRDGGRADETLAYFVDLYGCLQELRRVVKKGGHCCFVVGNRTMRRVLIPTDQILTELGACLGFRHKITIYRRIPSKRMPWENAPENIPGVKGPTMGKESIVILQNEG